MNELSYKIIGLIIGFVMTVCVSFGIGVGVGHHNEIPNICTVQLFRTIEMGVPSGTLIQSLAPSCNLVQLNEITNLR